MKLRWRTGPDGTPIVTLPCGHDLAVLPRWIGADGRFLGRLGCTESGCRRVVDVAVLEGWPPAGR